MPQVWVDAAFRISFAKNKTHLRDGYWLGLQNLLGVLPRSENQVEDELAAALELLRTFPPGFSIIDAFISSHGINGARIAAPLETRTLLAGRDLLKTDWAAANKMGLDPRVSTLHARVADEVGVASLEDVDSDFTQYDGWINVDERLASSLRQMPRDGELSCWLRSLLCSVNRELFPYRNLVCDRLNGLLSDWVRGDDQGQSAFLAVLLLCAGYLDRSIESLRIMFAKDQLRQRCVPLGFDVDDYTLADYEAVADYLLPLEEIMNGAPQDANGLRWCYLDESILFRYSRVVPAPYDDFVAQVDVSKSVQFMNDYIGGACEPVQRNSHGLVTHQATRTIYLPQPNYLALFGGKPIDVCKLELVKYAAKESKVHWRTICSLNASAEYDDGTVTFRDVGAEGTEVVICARQKFQLPLLMQIFNPDLVPPLKNLLVAHAYRAYFEQTIANFEAVYEGRDYRIGHVPSVPHDEPTNPAEDLLGQQAMRLVNDLGNVLRDNRRDWSESILGMVDPPRPEPEFTDDLGFQHFRATSTNSVDCEHAEKEPVTRPFERRNVESSNGHGWLETLFADLGNALKKDMRVSQQD